MVMAGFLSLAIYGLALSWLFYWECQANLYLATARRLRIAMEDPDIAPDSVALTEAELNDERAHARSRQCRARDQSKAEPTVYSACETSEPCATDAVIHDSIGGTAAERNSVAEKNSGWGEPHLPLHDDGAAPDATTVVGPTDGSTAEGNRIHSAATHRTDLGQENDSGSASEGPTLEVSRSTGIEQRPRSKAEKGADTQRERGWTLRAGCQSASNPGGEERPSSRFDWKSPSRDSKRQERPWAETPDFESRFTTDQLAEAIDFAATATRGNEKSIIRSRNTNAPPLTPLKAPMRLGLVLKSPSVAKAIGAGKHEDPKPKHVGHATHSLRWEAPAFVPRKSNVATGVTVADRVPTQPVKQHREIVSVAPVWPPSSLPPHMRAVRKMTAEREQAAERQAAEEARQHKSPGTVEGDPTHTTNRDPVHLESPIRAREPRQSFGNKSKEPEMLIYYDPDPLPGHDDQAACVEQRPEGSQQRRLSEAILGEQQDVEKDICTSPSSPYDDLGKAFDDGHDGNSGSDRPTVRT